MLVHLRVVPLDERVDVSYYFVLFYTDLRLVWIRLVVLVQVQVAFEEAMVKVQLGQLLQELLILLPIRLYHMLQELLHLVNIVNEDL